MPKKKLKIKKVMEVLAEKLTYTHMKKVKEIKVY